MMLDLESAIKHCEEVAHQNEILMKRYDDASGYSRSHNEKIRTNGAKGCEQLISLYRQLAEWLKELKAYREAEKYKWNNHQVACLLADIFGDTCACNYNGNDEWLPFKCELLDACPNTVGVACWEQYLTHREVNADE